MTGEILKEREVSMEFNIPVQTLRNDRHNGKGIPYYKVGRSVRYKRQDVVEFFESRKIIPANN